MNNESINRMVINSNAFNSNDITIWLSIARPGNTKGGMYQ